MPSTENSFQIMRAPMSVLLTCVKISPQKKSEPQRMAIRSTRNNVLTAISV